MMDNDALVYENGHWVDDRETVVTDDMAAAARRADKGKDYEFTPIDKETRVRGLKHIANIRANLARISARQAQRAPSRAALKQQARSQALDVLFTRKVA